MSAAEGDTQANVQWVARMHDLIHAAAFALQCRDHKNQGKGGGVCISLEDARSFAEEADAQADVWVEARGEAMGPGDIDEEDPNYDPEPVDTDELEPDDMEPEEE